MSMNPNTKMVLICAPALALLVLALAVAGIGLRASRERRASGQPTEREKTAATKTARPAKYTALEIEKRYRNASRAKVRQELGYPDQVVDYARQGMTLQRWYYRNLAFDEKTGRTGLVMIAIDLDIVDRREVVVEIEFIPGEQSVKERP
jgi:hypothetical protein